MARNKVQFQRGLSDVEFERLYGTEDKCRAALFSWRWPQGFACPACGCFAHCEREKRALWQCNACRIQTSLTAGMIFASTKLDLTVWFRAMFHMTQTKQGISAFELSRRLDVSYNTAWAMHHKLRQVMLERNQGEPLDGRIEMDDAYLGGERSGGKRGRGSPGKTPFVAAVETAEDGKAHRVKLRRVRRFTKKNIEKITGRIVKRGARVVTDGLGCFNGVADAGCMHEPIVTGSGRKAARHPAFRVVNTLLGNIKSAIAATFRSGRPARRFGHHAIEAELAQIERIDERVDHGTGLLSSIKSSRHSGNSVDWPRSASAMNRFIDCPRKSRGESYQRPRFCAARVKKRSAISALDASQLPPKAADLSQRNKR